MVADMTYEQYQAGGHFYSDYGRLSQWQRFRGLLKVWRNSTAPDKGIQFAALWDADDHSVDWARIKDWWRPRHWHLWHFGFDQCQNFHRLYLGPMVILFAC